MNILIMTATAGNAIQRQVAESVARLEISARTDAGGFRLHAAMMTFMGFGVLAMVSVLSLFGVLFFLMLMLQALRFSILLSAALAIPMLTFAYLFWHAFSTLGRTFCVRLPEPRGIYTDASMAPQLWNMVQGIAKLQGAPAVSGIYVTNDFEMVLRPRPRFGIFGGLHYDLLIGLPLLCALSPAHMRALVAHELGHLSPQVPVFHAWVHRLWDLWNAMMALTEGHEPNMLSRPYFNFLAWYTRTFYLYETALTRLDEAVADRCAAHTVGADALRDALIIRAVRTYYLREAFRPTNMPDSREKQAPTTDLCRQMGQPWPREAFEWFNLALTEKVPGWEHHAALAVRLQGLNVTMPSLPAVPRETATQAFVPEIAEEVMRQLDVLYPLKV